MQQRKHTEQAHNAKEEMEEPLHTVAEKGRRRGGYAEKPFTNEVEGHVRVRGGGMCVNNSCNTKKKSVQRKEKSRLK